MKEFGKTIKQTMTLSKEWMWFSIGMAVFGSIFGIILVLCVMTYASAEDYAHMGILCSLMCTGVVAMLGIVGGFSSDMNLAISMGKRRKYLVVAHYLTWVRNILPAVLVVVITAFLEPMLYSRLYPGLPCEINMQTFLLNPWTLALIVICVPAIVVFGGTLLMKFGIGICTAVFFGGIMVAAFLSGAMRNVSFSWLAKLVNSVGDVLAKPGCVPVVCLVGSVVCLILAQLLFRKQRVTY